MWSKASRVPCVPGLAAVAGVTGLARANACDGLLTFFQEGAVEFGMVLR